jgi:hypothetical protein
MRRQLRSFHSAERLAEIYAQPYDHTKWEDHRTRVARTIEITTDFGRNQSTPWFDGMDLSCGDGAILREVGKRLDLQKLTFGDMVFADHLDIIGPIETTLASSLVPTRPIDLFICSETLEHVENPDEILRTVRDGASNLVISTPIGETTDYGNEEHYWGWDVSDVEEMLVAAGWNDLTLVIIELPFYNFQVWCCA